jgi:hypothetical protein
MKIQVVVFWAVTPCYDVVGYLPTSSHGVTLNPNDGSSTHIHNPEDHDFYLYFNENKMMTLRDILV